MNYCTLLYFLLILCGVNTEENVISEQARQTVECISNLLKQGIPEVGVPSLEPFKLEEIEINLDEFDVSQLELPEGIERPELSGKVTLNNLEVSGLTDWDLSGLEIDGDMDDGVHVRFKGNVILPKLSLHTSYNGDIKGLDNNLIGDGEIDLTFKNIILTLDAEIIVAPLTIVKLSIKPKIGDVGFTITGLQSDAEEAKTITEFVEKMLTEWINEQSDSIAKNVEDYCKELFGRRRKRRDSNDVVNVFLEKCPFMR